MVFLVSWWLAAAPFQADLDAALELERQGQLTAALTAIEAVVARDPTWATARLEAARLRLKLGEGLERAGWHADIARSLAPENPRAHFLYGQAEDELGDRAAAARAFECAVALRPTFTDAQTRLATVRSALADWALAVPAWRAVVAANPAAHSARLQLAMALEGLGHLDAAEKELRALVAKPPVKAAATRRLVALLERTGRHAEAERLAKSLEPSQRVLRPLKPSAR